MVNVWKRRIDYWDITGALQIYKMFFAPTRPVRDVDTVIFSLETF